MTWSTKDDNLADDAVREWISVSEAQDPAEFSAWQEFRFQTLGAVFTPKAYTVPSAFPPTSQAGRGDYLTAISLIRKAIKWAMPKEGQTKKPPRGPYK